jgi:putative ABC transport system substrate-binding protein
VVHLEANIIGKWLAMLKEIAPRTGRAALLANPKTTPYDYFLQAAMALAPSLAMELVPSPVDDAADIERAIVAFARVPDVGLILPPDSTTILHRDLIIELAAPATLAGCLRRQFLCRGRGSYVLRNRSGRHVSAGGSLCRPHPARRQAG